MTIAFRRQQQLHTLLHRLGITPISAIDLDLLDTALTHPSLSPTRNYEQLEFVGDSVLRLGISLWLRERYGNLAVGKLAGLRSHLASDRVLAAIATTYGLGNYLQAEGSVHADPKAMSSALADALEAVMAALYCSTGNLATVRCWMEAHWQAEAEIVLAQPAMGNYKAALQELTQGLWKKLPEYRAIPSSIPINPANPVFVAEVWLLDRCWGRGEGTSIKAAQQEAARQAYAALNAAFPPSSDFSLEARF